MNESNYDHILPTQTPVDPHYKPHKWKWILIDVVLVGVILFSAFLIYKVWSMQSLLVQKQSETPQTEVEEKACGGITGETGSRACPAGYYCKYPNTPGVADESGKCVLDN